ncbi:heat shock protein Hsp18 [Clostridium magnum]|uniref:18 kDa heat shock protein n=1 Tax=Clostridium magnum DSM 2767 TaxID=1121326 RepID=A0A161W295_9CLOT|nr:heat shock protein Hsp18 [Clostridium magnum]KZL89300.1 18 kDa heat shock protein [Clostridium magnum DSM 2767]SHJ65402.1 heat shock protein Hsp20 [Clostridium magnum DSM 2767]
MFHMVPFKKNDLMRRDDFFSPLLKNFFSDDFLSTMHDLQGNFKVDLKETEQNYQLEADLPGIKKEDINIKFNNNYLVISAKRDESIEDNKENYVRRERHYGEFNRSFYIDNIDESKIDASFIDGVLRITLPKLTKGNDKKKKIDIH